MFVVFDNEYAHCCSSLGIALFMQRTILTKRDFAKSAKAIDPILFLEKLLSQIS
jgi:hypothetical protein